MGVFINEYNAKIHEEPKELDDLSCEFLDYVEKAGNAKRFDYATMEDFFARGLNANAYRVDYHEKDPDDKWIETLLGEVFWNIQGQDDDYYGRWVVKIVELFLENGLDISLLEGAFLESVFDGLRVSSWTTHIYEAVEKFLKEGMTEKEIDLAISIFEDEAGNLEMLPNEYSFSAEHFLHVVDMLKDYKRSMLQCCR